MATADARVVFAHNGWLADLTDRDNGDAEFDWQDFRKAPRGASETKGRVLSVPVVTERPALYYRKDLADPPRTLDELMDASMRLTPCRTGGGRPYRRALRVRRLLADHPAPGGPGDGDGLAP